MPCGVQMSGRPAARNAESTPLAQTTVSCVLLADRHPGVTEGVRGLLGTRFEMVTMVADLPSLAESAERLQPDLVVVDLSLTRDGSLLWLRQVRERCPEMKLIVLSVYDEPSVRRAVMAAGVDGFVLKRAIATDLLPAVEAVMAGQPRPSPG